MGYSYCTAAGKSLDAVMDYLREHFPVMSGSVAMGNSWTLNGRKFFYERGREQRDGAITGTIWETRFYAPTNDERCFRVGGVRIEPDGKITRFASVPKKYIDAAIMQRLAKEATPVPMFQVI